MVFAGMYKLLLLKHWQLLTLLSGLPVIIEILFLRIAILIDDKIPPFSTLPFTAVLLGVTWIYILGTNIQAKLPPAIKMNFTLFKITIFAPLAGLPFLSTVPVLVILIWIIADIYLVFFIAKAFLSAELQKPVKFREYILEMLLFNLFYPAGIWVLQPRINKMFSSKLNSHVSE